jgi:membrane protein DedA with SNARE-associated domain
MSFDAVLQAIVDYPYLGAAFLFLLCGLGLPLPEELILICGGYICAKFPERATLHWMMTWCAGAILAGDLLPFVLGRTFGTRLLRLRFLRLLVTKTRLAKFDRWFRRRGDLVIFIARFVPGIRMVAFFTAGTMKMRWLRFLILDGLGIAIVVPVFTYLGHRGAGFIDDVVETVYKAERSILIAALAGLLLASLWLWLWRRRRARARRAAVPRETYIQPRTPVAESSAPADPAPAACPAAAAPAASGVAPADAPPGPPATPTIPPVEGTAPATEPQPPPAPGGTTQGG